MFLFCRRFSVTFIHNWYCWSAATVIVLNGFSFSLWLSQTSRRLQLIAESKWQKILHAVSIWQMHNSYGFNERQQLGQPLARQMTMHNRTERNSHCWLFAVSRLVSIHEHIVLLNCNIGFNAPSELMQNHDTFSEELLWFQFLFPILANDEHNEIEYCQSENYFIRGSWMLNAEVLHYANECRMESIWFEL